VTTASLPAPVVRPNGKTWRGRKPVRVEEFTDPWDDTGFVVLGTHDVAHALALLGADRVFEYGLNVEQARTDWWRRVPWDPFGSYDSSYITDAERGTPCVVFAP